MISSFYTETVNEWVKKYPFKPRIEPYDPTKDNASCVRCGSKHKLSRHHKGNDFYFACLRPDLYAARYIQFLPEDVVKLCNKCHKYVHTYYKKMMVQVKQNYVRTQEVKLLPRHLVPTKEWCDYWINEFRNWFDKWIQKPYTKRKRRRKRGPR